MEKSIALKKASLANDDDSLLITWDKFYETLKKVSVEELNHAKNNVMKNYNLKTSEVKEVDEAFNGTNEEYLQIIQTNINKFIDQEVFNSTPEFMIEFMDMSNYLLEQIMEFSLSKVKGKLLLPTKWYKQIMRHKILRQQTKVVSNAIETKLCMTLSICKDRWLYSQYLVEWLRHLLNLTSDKISTLFHVLPDLLQIHMHTIKSNMKFKKTVKYIVMSNDVVKRDTLEYLDEVLTNRENVVNLAPESLKKGAVLLMTMFDTIDKNYEITEENEEKLDDISKVLLEWINGEHGNIKQVLDAIVQNLQLNMKIWPLDSQNKIDYVWSQIIML